MQTNIGSRQYGLDWLRIGAFGLLILYHIGMFFVPWEWHVKTAEPLEWLEWPMVAINPWRLSLLFVISGWVSREMLRKLASPSQFAGSRSTRLLIPLLVGVVFFVVPQPWLELRDRGAYSESLLHFWLIDYFEFGWSRGTPLPTYNHLWFVAYLWVYSMLLAFVAVVPASTRIAIQHCFDQLFGGWRLLLLPICWLAAARILLLPTFGETHALVDDPYAHAVYGFAFFFGVGLARSPLIRAKIEGDWKQSLLVAVLGYLAICASELLGLGAEVQATLRAAGKAFLAWGAILALIGYAQRHLHRDSPVRRYLTEAIFPYYIIHQTLIVVIGFYLKQSGVSLVLQFVCILVGTLGGCALTYELTRRVWWLRPLLGLKSSTERTSGYRSDPTVIRRPFDPRRCPRLADSLRDAPRFRS